MKKIHARVKKIRKILILTSVVAVTTIFLPGCDLFAYKRPFPDAYYTSNFIEGIGFDVFEGDNTTIPTTGAEPVTGMWDFAYRYQNWDGFDYMTRTPAGVAGDYPSVPSGLSATAPVFRLEVVNLIDGGDFEVDEAGTWTPTGSATVVRRTDSMLLAAASMKLDAGSSGKLNFTPNLVAGAPSFSVQNTYKAFFRYKTNDSLMMKIDDTTTITPEVFGTVASASIPSFQGSGSPPFFVFAPNAGNSFSDLFVDNFRISRMGNMELRLRLTPEQTEPDLEGGVYSFSIWVFSDPSAFVDPDPDAAIKTARSPYRINSFNVTMRAVSPARLTASADSYVPTSGWSKVTATLEPEALLFSSGVDPVLELVLDFNQSHAGRILLSQPELRFYPDDM